MNLVVADNFSQPLSAFSSEQVPRRLRHKECHDKSDEKRRGNGELSSPPVAAEESDERQSGAAEAENGVEHNSTFSSP